MNVSCLFFIETSFNQIQIVYFLLVVFLVLLLYFIFNHIYSGMEFSSPVVIVLIVLLVLIFNDQICQFIDSVKGSVIDLLAPEEHFDPILAAAARPLEPMRGHREHLEADPNSLGLPPGQTSDVLNVLGYTGQQPWGEIIKATELDPSTFVNHSEFVKDVRRFSSGANFTSVADDNTSTDFVNFRGLIRPSHVPIGDTARQQPDIDQSVLQRNPRFSWNSGSPNFRTPTSNDEYDY
jgi:hypothetical protein